MEGVSGSESSSSSSLHPRRLSTPVAWKRGTQIGEGSFGKVYRGMNSLTGELLPCVRH